MNNKGKPSLKDKEASTSYEMELVDDTDQLAIDPELIREIESKGLSYRWINAVKHKANYGFDARRWVPYKREQASNNSFGYTDPDGYIRRGDMLLAVQPKHVTEARRQKIQNKNKNLSQNHQKQAAEELKSTLKEAKISSKVYEGYDENN